ncbi:hypothetical protein KAI32_02270 [Candidatus Pacearchaeota archaeon]|nr:hypothetical protein [Candidatus Pacearchaeota archaeon]
MKNKKSNKNKKMIYWLAVIAIILVVFSLCVKFQSPLQTKTVSVKFSVDEKLGLVADTDELDFGRVILGSSSIKSINLTNYYNFPVSVRIFISKNLQKFIFSDSEFILELNESINVPFNLIVSDANFGDYSGEILFEFRKL